MASERLYGIGEPLLVREKDTGVEAAEYLRLVEAMGCNAWRCWMHLTQLLKDPETPDRDEVARYTAALDTAAAMDIEVTGMSHLWFLPEGCKEEKGERFHGQEYKQAEFTPTPCSECSHQHLG